MVFTFVSILLAIVMILIIWTKESISINENTVGKLCFNRFDYSVDQLLGYV